MPISLLTLFEAAVLASSLSVDAFTAGFAYGSQNIKIPQTSVQVINIICALITGLAILFGSLLKPYIPPWLSVALAFSILMIIGLIKLLDGIVKSVIRKFTRLNKQFKFSIFSIKFILNLYADPEEADVDASCTLSPKEAAALAVSVSLDGFAVGFGAALANVNGMAVVGWSLLTNASALMLGCWFGHKLARSIRFNLSWLGGAVLIVLAISKLF